MMEHFTELEISWKKCSPYNNEKSLSGHKTIYNIIQKT